MKTPLANLGWLRRRSRVPKIGWPPGQSTDQIRIWFPAAIIFCIAAGPAGCSHSKPPQGSYGSTTAKYFEDDLVATPVPADWEALRRIRGRGLLLRPRSESNAPPIAYVAIRVETAQSEKLVREMMKADEDVVRARSTTHRLEWVPITLGGHKVMAMRVPIRYRDRVQTLTVIQIPAAKYLYLFDIVDSFQAHQQAIQTIIQNMVLKRVSDW